MVGTGITATKTQRDRACTTGARPAPAMAKQTSLIRRISASDVMETGIIAIRIQPDRVCTTGARAASGRDMQDSRMSLTCVRRHALRALRSFVLLEQAPGPGDHRGSGGKPGTSFPPVLHSGPSSSSRTASASPSSATTPSMARSAASSMASRPSRSPSGCIISRNVGAAPGKPVIGMVTIP